MTEMLFILTTIFVAYVVYVMVNERNETSQNKAPESQAEPITEPAAHARPEATAKAELTMVAEPVKPAAAKPAAAKPEKPAAKPKPAAKAKPAAEKPKPAPEKPAAQTPEEKPDTDKIKGAIRNPVTGEIASATGNYLFTKRWIKDALVAEGLLDKVYKNNELNEEISQKIKDAQAKLEAMEKYKV